MLNGGVKFESLRENALEVDYFQYRKALQRLVKKMQPRRQSRKEPVLRPADARS